MYLPSQLLNFHNRKEADIDESIGSSSLFTVTIHGKQDNDNIGRPMADSIPSSVWKTNQVSAVDSDIESLSKETNVHLPGDVLKMSAGEVNALNCKNTTYSGSHSTAGTDEGLDSDDGERRCNLIARRFASMPRHLKISLIICILVLFLSFALLIPLILKRDVGQPSSTSSSLTQDDLNKIFKSKRRSAPPAGQVLKNTSPTAAPKVNGTVKVNVTRPQKL